MPRPNSVIGYSDMMIDWELSYCHICEIDQSYSAINIQIAEIVSVYYIACACLFLQAFIAVTVLSWIDFLL